MLYNTRVFRITTARYLELANQICEVFPSEVQEIYYMPYERKKDGSPIAARGKLFSAHQYIRKQLKNSSSEHIDASESEIRICELQSQNCSERMTCEANASQEATPTDFVPTKNVIIVQINFHCACDNQLIFIVVCTPCSKCM